jgi:hypothetical protein
MGTLGLGDIEATNIADIHDTPIGHSALGIVSDNVPGTTAKALLIGSRADLDWKQEAPVTYIASNMRIPRGLTSSKALAKRQANVLDVYLGTKRANIGVLSGPVIYDQIYKALAYLCPSSPCRTNERYNIEVAWKDKKVIRQGTLQVWLANGNFRNVKERNILIGMAAGYGEKSQNDNKNCFSMKVSGRKKAHRFCNMGNSIVINVSNMLGQLDVHFDSSPPVHKFDCVAVRQATTDYIKSLVSELEASFAWPVTTNVQCRSEKVDALDSVDMADTSEDITVDPSAEHLFFDDAPQQIISRSDIVNSKRNPAETVRIYLSTSKQNMGFYRSGSAAYHEVYKAIKRLCPSARDGCRPGPGEFTTISTEYQDRPTSLGHKDMKIWIKESSYPSPGIRDLLIGAIAGAAQAAREHPDNCRGVQYNTRTNKKMRITRHCNMMGSVNVKAGKHQIHAIFEFPTNDGNFNCDAIKPKTYEKLVALLPEWSPIFGGETAGSVDC